ncbi:MAG: hypothetical protein V1792_10415 [Pseudomonadota bacterium]
MAPPKPLAVIIEYDDGSKTSASFEALSQHLQFEILRQPFACRPSSCPEEEKFVLLEWEDGWKEVFKADRACCEINRYYVITNPEEVGRLSLNTREDGYPQLIEITRRPSQVRKITFTDTYKVSAGRTVRQDKRVKQFFDIWPAEDTLSDLVELMKSAIEDEGISLKRLKSGKETEPEAVYERIRRAIGVRPAFRQQDTHDFISYLLRRAR